MKGKFVVIVGPSASGKTELVKSLVKKIPNSARLVTTTTRSPRPDETNEYFFISRNEFEKGIREDEYFEYAEVYGNLYGSSRKTLESFLKNHLYVFAVIDVQGARTLKKKIKDVFVIFIRPGVIEDIRRRLLTERSFTSKEELQKRIDTCEHEISLASDFDAVIDNHEGHFDDLVRDTMKVVGV